MLGAVALPNIPTGNSLIVRPDTLPAETNNNGNVSTMSPMESAAAMFADMRDSLETIVLNTGKTADLLSKLVTGEKLDTRREAIERAETDEDVAPPEESVDDGGGSGGSSFLSSLNKFNPFSSESGALVKFIAAGLALIGLNIFKEKLIPKLSAVLEFFFGDGSEGSFSSIMDNIILKIKETVEGLREKLEPKIKEIKLKFDEFLERAGKLFTGVEGIVTVVTSIITKIEDYIEKFNVDGIDGLSEEEQKELRKDIAEKISSTIMDVFGNALKNIGATFKALTIASIALRLGSLALPATTTAAGVGVAGLGLLGTVALVAVAAAGIYALYDRITFAMNDELANADIDAKIPDNIVDKGSNAVAKFLGGEDPKGGLGNAIDNFSTLGLIGAVVGGILGSYFFGIGTLPGAKLGMAIGTLVGGGIGFGFGYVGSDEILKDLPSMKNFYENNEKLNKLFTGQPTSYDLDAEAIGDDLILQQEYLNKAIAEKQPDFVIKSLTKGKADLIQKLNDVPKMIAKQRSIEIKNIDGQITGLNNSVGLMSADLLRGNLEDHMIGPTTQAIEEAQNKIAQLTVKRDELVKANAIDSVNFELGTSQFLSDKKVLPNQSGPRLDPMGYGGLYYQPVSIDSSVKAIKTDNSYVSADFGAGINDVELAAAVKDSKT